MLSLHIVLSFAGGNKALKCNLFVSIVFMKSLLFYAVVGAFLSTGCTSTETDANTSLVMGREAKGDVVYGGGFRIAEEEKHQTLFPPNLVDLGSANISNQIYEGLLKFDVATMALENALAESYEMTGDGLVYTFRLKKGVYFHDDPCFPNGKGREMVAEDVKYSFEQLCSKKANPANFNTVFEDRLVGANAYYQGEADEVSGIKVLHPYAIELTLTRPANSFLFHLARPVTAVMAKEAVEKYGDKRAVGTGPFLYNASDDTDKCLILHRNNNYHLKDSFGNPLPYLDSLAVYFINSQNTQLERFRKGELDAINGLPSEKVKRVVKEQITEFSQVPPKYLLGRTSEMITQFYEFNLNSPVFKDIRVRKAFSYAINRLRIFSETLQEEAFGPGNYGLTPPSFPEYDIKQIKGYSFDPEKARNFLRQAGYPDGKGFPTVSIELNSGGTRHSRVAFEIQKQLSEVLNINVDIDVVSLAQKIEDSKFGRADIFRSAWVADFPSPETFLWICYGKNVPDDPTVGSYPNTMRYKNPKFDALFEKGLQALSKEKAYAYFREAEQVMMNDAPLLVLWYNENFRLLQSYIRNFHENPMNYLDCSDIYIKARTTGKRDPLLVGGDEQQ